MNNYAQNWIRLGSLGYDSWGGCPVQVVGCSGISPTNLP